MKTLAIDGIQLRGDSKSNWESANPVLKERELGLETDTLKFKFGDGETRWNSLSYVFSLEEGTITLGGNSITPLTSNSVLDATKVSGTLPESTYMSKVTTALGFDITEEEIKGYF